MNCLPPATLGRWECGDRGHPLFLIPQHGTAPKHLAQDGLRFWSVLSSSRSRVVDVGRWPQVSLFLGGSGGCQGPGPPCLAVRSVPCPSTARRSWVTGPGDIMGQLLPQCLPCQVLATFQPLRSNEHDVGTAWIARSSQPDKEILKPLKEMRELTCSELIQ